VISVCGYAPPDWLAAPAKPGVTRAFDIPVRALDAAVSVRTFSLAGVPDEEPLPLLLVHDGPEYDALAGLTQYLSAGIAGGWLPRLRAALLGPGPRDRWYSANTRYARALAVTVIPELSRRMAVTARIGMGASLGALAMLHAHGRHPGALDALFLQSGSFFTPRLDPQERRFPYYERVTRFVAGVHEGGVHAGGPPALRIPVELTCGVAEENVANNRLMAATLRARGYPAALHEVPDGHNFTAWRGALDPYLTALLRRRPA
jgi:enterochelin esterase-like enzyme